MTTPTPHVAAVALALELRARGVGSSVTLDFYRPNSEAASLCVSFNTEDVPHIVALGIACEPTGETNAQFGGDYVQWRAISPAGVRVHGAARKEAWAAYLAATKREDVSPEAKAVAEAICTGCAPVAAGGQP